MRGLKFHGVGLLYATALLTACSGIPLKQRQDAQRARYEAYAGAPVERFTYLGRYDSWQPIGTNELVVWTTINQAYLIKVAPPCDNLEFVNRIGLTSTASTVSARFDFVKVGRQCLDELACQAFCGGLAPARLIFEIALIAGAHVLTH